MTMMTHSLLEAAMSRTVTAARAKSHFADCLRHAGAGDVVVITRYGRPVVAMVPAAELVALDRMRAAAAAEGLAGIAGMFEDGDEIADSIDAVVSRRSLARPLPERG